MKCEVCKLRESAIHVQQIIGDEKVDMYLCEVCAAEKGISKQADAIELSLSQLLTGLFSAGSETAGDREVCPNCGTGIDVIRKEGRLGCPECYGSFTSEIRAFQKKLSGSIRHVGKLPKKLRAYKELIIDRHELKSRLDEAVQNEDYERAAVLRDQIREIERRSEL